MQVESSESKAEIIDNQYVFISEPLKKEPFGRKKSILPWDLLSESWQLLADFEAISLKTPFQ